MRIRLLSILITIWSLSFLHYHVMAGGTDLRLLINLDKSEIKKGELTIVHYELQGADRDLMGASVTLQGVKLISNKGFEVLSPDSSTIYVFQVLKYNKPLYSKSITVYVIQEGSNSALNLNSTENLKSEQLIAKTTPKKSTKQRRVRVKSLHLGASLEQDEITPGDSTYLRYRLDGKAKHLAGAQIYFNGERLNNTRGNLIVYGDSTKNLILQVKKDGASIIKKEVTLIVNKKENAQVVNNTTTINTSTRPTTNPYAPSTSKNYTTVTQSEESNQPTSENSDGRFNIIGGGKYLTYSGNATNSSSHFIIQVGDAFASNDPNLKNTTYLKAQEQLDVPFVKGSSLAEDVFYFENIRITQRLTPVDSNLNPIQKNTWGSVYKIEYELDNYSLQDKTINFITLNDFMLAQNDNPRAYVNNNKLLNTWTCDKKNMPESIQLRLYNSTTKINARCILKHGLLNGPDSLYYGNWQFIHQLTHIGKIKKQEVVDNALLLKWSNIQIAAQHKKTISYAYGFSGKGKVDVQMIDANIHFVESILYYKMGATDIGAKTWKLERKTLLRLKPRLEHVDLIGHTDAMGTEISNIKLSKLRCMGIKLLMVAAGVNKDIITIKPMGEIMADQSLLARKKGKKEDRKVIIHYFTTSTEQH